MLMVCAYLTMYTNSISEKNQKSSLWKEIIHSSIWHFRYAPIVIQPITIVIVNEKLCDVLYLFSTLIKMIVFYAKMVSIVYYK